MPTPKSVTVVVYGGKCLTPKKGVGEPSAWVIFGFGKSKCCTARVRDRNPTWNEESSFNITDPKLPLKITVKDKDDMLGQVQIPLTDIPYEEHTFKWLPLGPHRRNLNPTGEICIDCWITEYSDADTPTKKETNFFKFKQKFNIKQLNDKGKHGSIKYGGTSMKGSVSVEDLGAVTYKPTFSQTLERPKHAATGMKRASSLFLKPEQNPFPKSERSPSLTELSPVEERMSDPPEIKLVTPISGPSAGGTVIQITGNNLGSSARDIMGLTVAGYNCLATIEYISSNKLMCTTPPGDGMGPVSLVTASGGSCSSKIQFEYENIKEAKPLKKEAGFADFAVPPHRRLTLESIKPNGKQHTFGGKGQGKKEPSKELKKEVEELTSEVQDLKKENKELRNYVDRLLLYLMEKYPEALESRRLYR